MPPNPLATNRTSPQKHPAYDHARAWDHVRQMDPDSLAEKIAQVDHVLPILGALANNPKVTIRDVIKAAAGAVADGKVKPEQAVKFIAQMPSDPEKVQGSLKALYAANLSGAVHMKAALMGQAQQVPQAPQQAMSGNPLGAPQ